ncbi:MAG TPA: hypothetical protein VJX94_10910 [Stellaceae bacterium]|nr:hypothetical protein [Stellaceae bacterium]
MVRKHRCGKRAEVSSAPRGVKRMTGKVLGNLRDLVEYVAELWRMPRKKRRYAGRRLREHSA